MFHCRADVPRYLLQDLKAQTARKTLTSVAEICSCVVKVPVLTSVASTNAIVQMENVVPNVLKMTRAM